MKIKNELRAKMDKMRPRLTEDEYNLMVADAQAAADEMEALNTELLAPRLRGAMAHDAVPAGVLARMLEVVVAQAEREREVVYEWRNLFPIENYDWRASTIYIPVWSSEGMAAWYYGGGNHPNVAAGMRTVSISMRMESISYTVDWLETQTENFAGVQSEPEKVQRCFTALDAFASDVIFKGNTEAGFAAFVGHPNIADGPLPFGAWDADDADPDEMYWDVKYAVSAVYTQNEGVEGFAQRQVEVWVAPAMYNIISDTTRNTFTGASVLAALLTDPRIRAIRPVTSLSLTACGAKDYLICGVFDRTEISVPMGADRMRIPATDGGHFMTQPFVTKLGGIHVKRPLSFFRGTGLLDA